MAQEKLESLKGWFGRQKVNADHRVTMEGLLKQARQSMEVFVSSGNMIEVEKTISNKLMRYAYGIIFLTEVNVGILLGGGRVGTGVIITRLTTNRWSAPIAVGNVAFSFGPQLGASKVDHVIMLPSPEALQSFLGKGQISIKGHTQLTLGTVGRDAQIGVGVSMEGKLAPIISYSIGAKGLYGGLSIGSVVLAPRSECNSAFYGYPVDIKDITSGHIEAPLLNEDYKRIADLLNVHQSSRNSSLHVGNDNLFMGAPAEMENYHSMDHGQDPSSEYQQFDARL